MEKKYITQEQHDLYKKFLTKKDFIKVAEYTQYSVSTVYNIYNMRTKLNIATEMVVNALNVITYVRMQEDLKTITKESELLKKLTEVKQYNKLKKSEKWT